VHVGGFVSAWHVTDVRNGVDSCLAAFPMSSEADRRKAARELPAAKRLIGF
jgi:hypothetical protein